VRVPRSRWALAHAECHQLVENPVFKNLMFCL